MNTDLSMQMMQMNAARQHGSIQLAVFKKANDMQNELLNSLMEVAQSAPPPGQGVKVDKLA